jgi:lipopolysaccharide export system permease protein
MVKIIDRYILQEMFFPFFTSLFAITFILIIGKILQLMDMMVNKGVSIGDIAKLIIFLMPYFFLFTIPISLLFSILIGLGRLSTDNEITVLKGAGLSLYRLSAPIAGASFALFLIALSLSLFFVPHSNHATKNLLFTIIKTNASVGIREKIFNDNFKGILLYANNIPAHGRYMEGVIISDTRTTREPSTIFADKAYLISDPESMRVSLRLENGSTHAIDSKRKYYRKMDFSSYDVNLDMDGAPSETSKAESKDSMEMTAAELMEKIKTPGIEEAAKRELYVELNNKFTFPLTCLTFGILGMPLGITVRKSARARGVTIGIIIVLCYYLLQLWGTALTETGKISPWIGSWFPNAIFAIAGIYLFIMTAMENKTGFQNLHLSCKSLVENLRRDKK